jgi:hypothetical protein
MNKRIQNMSERSMKIIFIGVFALLGVALAIAFVVDPAFY